MRKLIIKVIGPFVQAFAKYYFKKERPYNYKHIKGVVLPEVFFPHFTISTKLLMQHIEPLSLSQKSFLELGCGTGLISVLAAQKGALVTSSDINPEAIRNVKLNATKNKVTLNALESDLFSNIPKQTFDYILINPPYYPRKPESRAEEAWFCGENFEYFEKLFSSLPAYFNENSTVLMILSEDCELAAIQRIAANNKIKFECTLKVKRWGEENYIFQLKSV